MSKYWAYRCRPQCEDECLKAWARVCNPGWEAVRQKKIDDVNIDYEVTEPYEANSDREAQKLADNKWDDLPKHN